MDDPVFNIMCPFIEVKVRMGCEAIDRFGSFPLFILDAFDDGYTQEEIRESSGFSETVVEQHVRSLLEEELIEEGSRIRVTKRGKENLHEDEEPKVGFRFESLCAVRINLFQQFLG